VAQCQKLRFVCIMRIMQIFANVLNTATPFQNFLKIACVLKKPRIFEF
jgi:hypothetical protein